jgi:hypothetical protein
MGISQLQFFCIFLVVGADADGKQMEPGTRRHAAVGAQHDLPVMLGDTRVPHYLCRFQEFQHQRQHVGAVGTRNVYDWNTVGGRVPAAILVPAQDTLCACVCVVETLRRPGNPTAPGGAEDNALALPKSP